MEFVLGLLFVALIIYLAIIAIILLVFCLAVGLVIGVFPALFNAIKGYFASIHDEVDNPFLKWVMYICVGLGVLCIVAPIIIVIIGIITALA